jgi:hypothetical protein
MNDIGEAEDKAHVGVNYSGVGEDGPLDDAAAAV